MSKTSTQYQSRFNKDVSSEIEELKEEKGWNDSEALRYLVRQGLEAERNVFFQNKKYVEPAIIASFFFAIGAALGFAGLLFGVAGLLNTGWEGIFYIVAGGFVLFGVFSALVNILYQIVARGVDHSL